MAIDTNITADTNVADQRPAGGQTIETVNAKPAKVAKPLKSKTRTVGTPAAANPKAKRSTTTGTDSIGAKQRLAAARHTKADIILKKLSTAKGATIESLMEVTGWQAHSIRGLLSAVVRKRLGLTLISEVSKDGVRRYRIDGDVGAVAA